MMETDLIPFKSSLKSFLTLSFNLTPMKVKLTYSIFLKSFSSAIELTKALVPTSEIFKFIDISILIYFKNFKYPS